MKTLKTLALAALTVGFMSAAAFAAGTPAPAPSSCDPVAECNTLQKACDALSKGSDADKAKAAQIAQQIAAIKNEADTKKACQMAAECKKMCGISN